MKFSKKIFLEDAPSGIKRQLKECLDTLDGLDVIFDGRYGRDGYIPQYFSNGQEHDLYPVYKSWCV